MMLVRLCIAVGKIIKMYCGLNKISIRPTRFKELGYVSYAGIWRFVDTETKAAVGPIYKTKSEMLADLERYARDNWGIILK